MRPVTLDLSQVSDPAVKAALAEIQRASIDTLQNDTSSSGAAMSTLIGAAADEIAYFTSQTTTAFTALTSFIRTLLGAADAATARATLGAGTGNGNGSITSIATTAPITGGTITTTGTIGLNTTPITNSIAGNVSLNNTANFFDGPSVAQGTTGTWFASGSVDLFDSVGAANFYVKLWDGTTVVASANVRTEVAGGAVCCTLSGFFTAPAGNIRFSVRDITSTNGQIIANTTSQGHDSTITALRIA